MIDFALPLAGLGLLLCLLDWRRGFLLTVTIGFLADPIRKLIPGQPVSFTIAVAVFALACLVGAIGGRGLLPARQLTLQYRTATLPLQIFFGWVIFAAIMTVVNHDSLILAGIGAVAYLAPVPGLLLAYYYAISKDRIDRFSKLYVALCALMSVGIFLNLAGLDWPALKSVGPEMVISRLGQAYAGFFRTPEVAAWHAAAAICLVVILTVTSTKSIPRWLAATLIVFFLIAGLMTGRRKMIAQVILFGSLYTLLLAYYRGTAKRLVTLGLVVAVLGGVAVTELVERSQVATEGPRFEGYLRRGTSVFEDAPDRLEKLGLGSVVWAFKRHGWLGSGAGVSSQGSQHFGGGFELVGGAGEGGLGKIVVELGIPGLALGLWFLIALGRTVSRTIEALSRTEPELANLACGLAALLGAQVPTFVAAAQIYGDPFVLIVLGVVLGFLAATPSLAESLKLPSLSPSVPATVRASELHLPR